MSIEKTFEDTVDVVIDRVEDIMTQEIHEAIEDSFDFGEKLTLEQRDQIFDMVADKVNRSTTNLERCIWSEFQAMLDLRFGMY